MDMEYSPFGDEWTQQPRVFNLGGERRLPEHFSWKLAFGILDKSLKAGSPRIQYKDGTSGILTPEKRATRK